MEKQFTLFPSPYCQSCPAHQICHEQYTANGCWPGGPPDPRLLHPTNGDWLKRFVEVNDFGFKDVLALDQNRPALPQYIPRIRIDNHRDDYHDVAAVALSLREAECLAGKVRERKVTAKEILRLRPDCLLIILGFATDAFLEDVWRRERRQQVLDAIRVCQPDLAVAWGFSVWHRHAQGWAYPRAEQLYNLKRSLITFTDLQRCEVPAIPHIYWGNDEDLVRWGEWLTANPSVSTVAIDIQTADTRNDWKVALRGLAYLRSQVPRALHILVNGPCALRRIRELIAVWPDCSITNFGAYFSLTFRYKKMYGLQARWVHQRTRSRRAIFEAANSEYVAATARPSGNGKHLNGLLDRKPKSLVSNRNESSLVETTTVPPSKASDIGRKTATQGARK